MSILLASWLKRDICILTKRMYVPFWRKYMESKKCFRCSVELPLNRFYFDKTHNKYISSCKSCIRKGLSEIHRQKRKEADHKKYLKSKLNGKKTEYENRMMEKYPEKYKARYALRGAVKIGKIKKLSCEVCGEVKVEAHHPDYSKPLEVKWLCMKHHKELHNKEKLQLHYQL